MAKFDRHPFSDVEFLSIQSKGACHSLVGHFLFYEWSTAWPRCLSLEISLAAKLSINPVPLVSGNSSCTPARILTRCRRHIGVHRQDVLHAATTAQDPSHERC